LSFLIFVEERRQNRPLSYKYMYAFVQVYIDVP